MKLSSKFRQFCLGVIVMLLPLGSIVANKIVLIGSAGQGESLKGFLASLELRSESNVNSYSIGNYVVEIEPDAEKFTEVSQDSEVVAILCEKSAECSYALADSAAKDVLVITLTATAVELAQGQNILRLAPSNTLQAQAIHEPLSKDIGSQGRFAVVYEPSFYGLDLFKSFMATYMYERLYERSPPTMVATLPLHTDLDLQDSQKGVDATKIIGTLQSEQLDAIVYLGGAEGFLNLTNNNREITTHWYASEAVSNIDLANEEFDNLKIIALFFAENFRSTDFHYYYGYDAGKFLSAIVDDDFSQTPPANRTEFLQIAKKTVLDLNSAKTGIKSFISADQEAFFFVRYLEEGEIRSKVIKAVPQ